MIPSAYDGSRQPVATRALRVLVIGGGDIGSAVAHVLHGQGAAVVVSELPRSTHARRGMAFIDALYDGSATLAGVEARLAPDIAAVGSHLQSPAMVIVAPLPERALLDAFPFDAVVDATLRRDRTPPDLRGLAPVAAGIGPGYEPGRNCDVAIESQWGPAHGAVLRDRATAPAAGGPNPLGGVGRERFAVSPADGEWRSSAHIGLRVHAGEEVGRVGDLPVRAPIDGWLRGVTRDGVVVRAGRRVLEVDPRDAPQLAGLGERPLAIAHGVAAALGLAVSAGASA